MKCYGCGCEKDDSQLEVYPYPEDDRLTTDPIPPLFVIECESERRDPKTGYHEFRIVVVCHRCFHKLEPDMWISERCWKAIDPVVPFDKLPLPVEGERWNPTDYPEL